MAYTNSEDPDQTAEETVWSGSRLFAFPPIILWNKCIKKQQQNLGKK